MYKLSVSSPKFLDHNPFTFSYLFIKLAFGLSDETKLCVNRQRTKLETEDNYIAECHIAWNYRLPKLGERWLKVVSWYLQLFFWQAAIIVKVRKTANENRNSSIQIWQFSLLINQTKLKLLALMQITLHSRKLVKSII